MSAKPEKKDENKSTEGTVTELNTADFLKKVFNFKENPEKWVYEGDKPCIIDFYATWCGPCKKLAPVLVELAKQYKDEIVFYKIDAEKEIDVSRVFGVQSYPSILFIPAKGKPTMVSGFESKESLIKQINKYIIDNKQAE